MRPLLVPEVQLLVADDVVALWEAMEDRRRRPRSEPPFWAAAWPGGQALARYVLDHPRSSPAGPVLDLGSGSGLVAVAAALAGARRVVASEIDPYGATAIAVNAETTASRRSLVVGDLLDDEPPDVDVVLAGDVCYDRAMSERVLPYLEAWRAARGATRRPGTAVRADGPADRGGNLRRPGHRRTEVRRTTVWRLP